jgi:hypothetical protein
MRRSRLSHLISLQNDILKSARFSLEGTDGISHEVSSKVLKWQDGAQQLQEGHEDGGSGMNSEPTVPSCQGLRDGRHTVKISHHF